MEILGKLIPLKIDERIEAVSGYVGKVKRTAMLLDKSGRVLIDGCDIPTLNYIKEAVNNYHKTDISVNAIKYMKFSVITHTFTLPGTPMQRTDSKRILQNPDGTFILCNNKKYTDRIRYHAENLRKVYPYSRKNLPVKIPVNAECLFYIKPAKAKGLYSLAYLLTACIDELYKLKLIAGIGSDIIRSTDGSTVVFVTKSSEERTVINIRKISEE